MNSVKSINYLTQYQWMSIKSILKHPKSTSNMINTCNQIIFQHYKHYAYNMAYDFKTSYYKKCRHIPLDELKLYADLVSPGCILLVLDTVIDDLEVDPDRPWGPGASPKSAVIQFMKSRPGIFENLSWLERRSVLSVAPNGYWLRSDKSKKE